MSKSSYGDTPPGGNKDFDELIDYLASIQTGRLKDPEHLSALLEPCWEQFNGGDAEGMAGSKLFGRMESVEWEPPALTFIIERHGGTVQGSTRAGLHHWHVDMDSKSAGVDKSGHRQLQPMQPRLNVHPLAEHVAELIFNKETDERIKWNGDGSVKVNIGKIIPSESASRQTVEGRRKRFREALNDIVTAQGWEVVRANVYRRPDA